MTERDFAPPMRVWGLTIVILLTLGISTFIRVKTSFVRSSVKHLSKLDSGSQRKVIAIGSSLLEAAVSPDSARYLLQSTPTNSNYLQLTRTRALLSDFYPLMNKMLEVRPEIVLIQASLLWQPRNVLNQWDERFKHALQKHRAGLKRLIAARIFSPMGIPDTDLNQTGSFKKIHRDSSLFADVVRFRNQFTVMDSELDEDFKTFLLDARARNTRIIVVDVPRYAGLEEQISGSKNNKQRWTALHDVLQTGYGVRFMEFPDTLSLDHYKDFSHFNSTGRDKYSRWLFCELMQPEKAK